MMTNEKLGLYWGQDAFCFVETKKGQPVKIAAMPFDTTLNTNQDQDVPEGLEFTALIQKAIREHGITSKHVNLSLPAKDLIFRSFVIPWMTPDEIKNVVEFEAPKYIPIKLEELAHTWHAIPFTENNRKKLRIIFAAIRKTILERYTGILEHTGLQVDGLEPAPVSLVRVLRKHKYLSPDDSSVIIEIGHREGRVIIVDHDVIQFVREFQMPANRTDAPPVLTAQLFNDLRVSLNFYTRISLSFYTKQNVKARISKIITVSLADLGKLPEELSAEFETPVTSIKVCDILKTGRIADVGFLSAYGITLREKGSSTNTKDFDLSSTARRLQKSKKREASKISGTRVTAGTIAVCAFIIFQTAIFTDKMVSPLRKRRTELQAEQKTFQNLKISQIRKMKKDLSDKLIAYKDVRLKSNASFYLAKIPQLLPRGTWLNNLDIKYYETESQKNKSKRKISKVIVTLDGYAYLEDPQKQFRSVNNLVARLKGEEALSNSFNKIDLVTMKQKNLEGYPVTYFKIVCQ